MLEVMGQGGSPQGQRFGCLRRQTGSGLRGYGTYAGRSGVSGSGFGCGGSLRSGRLNFGRSRRGFGLSLSRLGRSVGAGFGRGRRRIDRGRRFSRYGFGHRFRLRFRIRGGRSVFFFGRGGRRAFYGHDHIGFMHHPLRQQDRGSGGFGG